MNGFRYLELLQRRFMPVVEQWEGFEGIIFKMPSTSFLKRLLTAPLTATKEDSKDALMWTEEM